MHVAASAALAWAVTYMSDLLTWLYANYHVTAVICF